MRTTILKIGKLHLWVSGSMVEPYSNIYFNAPKTECGYRGLDIFPYFKIHKCQRTDGTKYNYIRRGFSNSTPKLLQWYLRMRSGYKHWYSDYDHLSFNTELEPVIEKRPGFLTYIINTMVREYKMSHCHHNFEVESHISPDSGSEDFFCPKCGYSAHITWY